MNTYLGYSMFKQLVNTKLYYGGIMKKYFSIGETAKINNVSIQALRLYDKMGLLKPAYVDPDSNYRYYTLKQFMYIDFIKYSKHIGAPLKELKDVLHSKDITKMLAFIQNQQNIVEKEIIKLKNISKAIGALEEKIKYGIEIQETNKIHFRDIEKRFILDVALNEKYEDDDIEIRLREMERSIEENDIMLEGEGGYLINCDLFLNKGEINYEIIYSTICGNGIKKKNLDIRYIPGGKFICITYLNDERERSVEELRKYIKENNIKPLGITVEATLFNTLEQWENSDTLYQLQILI